MKRFLVFIAIAFAIGASHAAEEPPLESSVVAASRDDARKLSTEQQLEDLAKLLGAAREDAADLLKQVNSTKDEAEKKRIQTDLNKVNLQIDDLMAGIEKVAAGSLEAEVFASAQQKGFDWQHELEEIFKPIVVELKQMTARARNIERLRSEIAFYEERLPVATRAVQKLDEYLRDAQSPSLTKELKKIADRWRSRRDEIQNKLKVSRLELETLLAPAEEEASSVLESVKQFLSGRGLSLALAIGGFATALFLLRFAHSVYERSVSRSGTKRKRFSSRLVNFLFATLSVVVALVTAMIILSIRGDWLLLGLLLIVLVAAALALRHSLPLYIREARILLNIGPVREDERVLYNGLPWRVADLSVYTTLVNPMLRGGRLRLALSEIATLNSRPMAEDEAWFPTREGDYVLLEDNTFGRILAQTPEYVDMAVAGSVQTYPVSAFLGKNPRNLSVEGFGMLVELGLDYRYQSDITSRIRDDLEQFVRDQLQQHPYGKDLKDLIVEFNTAAASSLNIAVIGVFTGEAAPNYFGIRRLLNKLTVDACNHFGWSIPFNQISVHMETPINMQPAALGAPGQ